MIAMSQEMIGGRDPPPSLSRNPSPFAKPDNQSLSG